MTVSNSPFCVTHQVCIQVPSQVAWDLFCAPESTRSNPAIRRLDTTLGFHTGSLLTFELQSLSGPISMVAEVTESVPPTYLEWEHCFYHWLCRHSETWSFEFTSTKSRQTLITARYHLNGVFAAKLWPNKRAQIHPLIELWLESLKQQLERL